MAKQLTAKLFSHPHPQLIAADHHHPRYQICPGVMSPLRHFLVALRRFVFARFHSLKHWLQALVRAAFLGPRHF